MKTSYWQQKAAPWVSGAVLIGGLTSACILFFLVRIDNSLEGLDQKFDNLEENIKTSRSL